TSLCNATHSGGVLVGQSLAGTAWNIRLFAVLSRTYCVQREVNDETRSDRCRKRGHFGFNCLGGVGECPSQYQPKHLPGHTRSEEGAAGGRSRPEKRGRHVCAPPKYNPRLRLPGPLPAPKGGRPKPDPPPLNLGRRTLSIRADSDCPPARPAHRRPFVGRGDGP